jgi:putative NADH-flavin reductase
MHLALFGASGRTGLLLSERALAEGHTVTALLRHPETYPYAARVRVVRGDAFTPAAIAETLVGADAVLSGLGARSLGKEDVLERAVPLIITAMQQAKVRRIVVLGSAGALDSGLDKQPAVARWLVEHVVYETLLKWPVASQRAQYAALAGSGLDWTMVMPPMLTNGPARGRYRVDGEALPRSGASISRADVADFMMAQLQPGARQWIGKGVYVSN